jgi:hypothetical protein
VPVTLLLLLLLEPVQKYNGTMLVTNTHNAMAVVMFKPMIGRSIHGNTNDDGDDGDDDDVLFFIFGPMLDVPVVIVEEDDDEMVQWLISSYFSLGAKRIEFVYIQLLIQTLDVCVCWTEWDLNIYRMCRCFFWGGGWKK